jgi:hypothetical protein
MHAEVKNNKTLVAGGRGERGMRRNESPSPKMERYDDKTGIEKGNANRW